MDDVTSQALVSKNDGKGKIRPASLILVDGNPLGSVVDDPENDRFIAVSDPALWRKERASNASLYGSPRPGPGSPLVKDCAGTPEGRYGARPVAEYKLSNDESHNVLFLIIDSSISFVEPVYESPGRNQACPERAVASDDQCPTVIFTNAPVPVRPLPSAISRSGGKAERADCDDLIRSGIRVDAAAMICRPPITPERSGNASGEDHFCKGSIAAGYGSGPIRGVRIQNLAGGRV
jgi:hypothetical protein